jgi:hypothetical protein
MHLRRRVIAYRREKLDVTLSPDAPETALVPRRLVAGVPVDQLRRLVAASAEAR